MGRKNIVLFSDGTNNKGGTGRDTNVYRLYKMLDNDLEHQLAYYDDGVGTQSLSPMKWAGLAIGVGLSQNVEDLYLSLISHYESGDHIYLFGFSRGAFTVRMLANLIDFAGVPSDSELKSQPQAIRQWAHRALEEYKLKMESGNGHYLPNIQRCKPQASASFSPEKDPGQCAEIRCIGVWDTVNATGHPVKRIREMIAAKWLQDQSVARLPQCVHTSFHALAIDEERLTFTPTLWNEKALEEHQHVEQVWFAGVHSNVGGGYPKDGMAQVPLEWMLSRLEALPELASGKYGDGLLHFNDLRNRVPEASDVNGKQYNSRAGMSAFYRYRPRDICSLSKAATDQRAPLIHQSVLQRIGNITAFYAPYMIRQFRGVDAVTGEVSEKIMVQSKYQMTGNQGEGDSRLDILHSVNARAILYWMFIALIVFGLTLPWIAERMSWFGAGGEVPVLSDIIGLLNHILPDFLEWWVNWYVMHPFYLLALIVSLFFNRMVVKKRLESRMEMVASDMWLNLNNNVLVFFTEKDAKDLPEKEALRPRNLKVLHAIERMFMNLERWVSKMMRWRSE